MNRFYILLWLRWAIKVTINTFILSSLLAIFITFGIYIAQGVQPLESEIVTALIAIFKFWFALSWNFALLIILFRSLKYIFNRCVAGYVFELLGCYADERKEKNTNVLMDIGYGDLVKVWRKWFMLLIWIVAIQMVVTLIIMKLFSSYENIFDWFNIYLLYIFIIIGGYFSFIVLSIKCQKVRIRKC